MKVLTYNIRSHPYNYHTIHVRKHPFITHPDLSGKAVIFRTICKIFKKSQTLMNAMTISLSQRCGLSKMRHIHKPNLIQ